MEGGGGLHAVNVNDQLRLAASSGHLDQIQDCLEAGAIFDLDADGRSALHYAALKGYTDVTRFLLEKGCQINTQDASGYTPLHRAASQGHIEVITVLLEAGCEVNSQDEHGNAAIHEASWNGYSKTLELLVKHEVNVVLTNKAGFTSLHLSAQNGHNESTRVLLYAGCDSDIKNNYGDTALHTAARYGHAGVTRILISGRTKLHEQNKNGDTALHIAAALKRRKIAKLLVESGIDVLMKNKQNETAVDVARRKEHTEIINIVQSHRKPHIPGKMVNFKDDLHMDGPVVVPDLESPIMDKQETKPDKKRFFFFKKKKAKEKSPANGGVVSQKAVPGSHVHVGRSPVQGFFSKYVPRDGVQYYRDLAGNVKKGPVGYSPTCNCMPALNQLERQVHDTRDTVYDHIHTNNRVLQDRIEQVDHRASMRVHALEQFTRDRFQEEEHMCRQRISQHYQDESDYYNPQNENVKMQIQSWLEQKLEGYGHCLHHHHDDSALPNENIFSEVHETANGRLFKSRSDETLSQSDNHSGKGYHKREFYESRQEAMQQIRAWQVPKYSKDRNKIKILEKQRQSEFEHKHPQRSHSRPQLPLIQDSQRYPMEPIVEIRNKRSDKETNRVPHHYKPDTDNLGDDSTYVTMTNYGKAGAPSHIPQTTPQYPTGRGSRGPVTHSTPKSRESSPYDSNIGMTRSKTDGRISGHTVSEVPKSKTDPRLSRNVHNSEYKSDAQSAHVQQRSVLQKSPSVQPQSVVQTPVSSAINRSVRQLFSPDKDQPDSDLSYNSPTSTSQPSYNNQTSTNQPSYNSPTSTSQPSYNNQTSTNQPSYNSPTSNNQPFTSALQSQTSSPLRNSTSSERFAAGLPKPTFTTFGYDESMDGHTAPVNSPEQRGNISQTGGDIPASSTPRSVASHSSHEENQQNRNSVPEHHRQNSQVSTGFVPTTKDDNYMDMSYMSRNSTLNQRSRSSEGLLEDSYGPVNGLRSHSENRAYNHSYSHSQSVLTPRSQSESRRNLQQSYLDTVSPSRPLPQPQVSASSSRVVTHPQYSSTPYHSGYPQRSDRPPVAPKPAYNGYSSVRDVRYQGNQNGENIRNDSTYSSVKDVKSQKDVNQNLPGKTVEPNSFYGQEKNGVMNYSQLEPRSKSAYSTYLTGDTQYSRENSPNICNNSKEDSSSNPDSGYSSKIYGNRGATPVSASSTPSSSFSTDRGISLPSNTNSPQSQYSNADYEGLPQTEYQDEIQNHIQSWYQRKIQETTQKVFDNWRGDNKSPAKPQHPGNGMRRYQPGNHGNVGSYGNSGNYGNSSNYAQFQYKDPRQGMGNIPQSSYNGQMNYNNPMPTNTNQSYLVHSSDV